jgi:hypothetical protein
MWLILLIAVYAMLATFSYFLMSEKWGLTPYGEEVDVRLVFITLILMAAPLLTIITVYRKELSCLGFMLGKKSLHKCKVRRTEDGEVRYYGRKSDGLILCRCTKCGHRYFIPEEDVPEEAS